MKSNRALLLTLATIIGALMLSVVSYAQSAPAASTSNIVTMGGISGGGGQAVSQGVPGSATLLTPAPAGAGSLTVSGADGFAAGDYVRVDDGSVVSYHTVSSVAGGVLSITPVLASAYPGDGSTSVTEQAVYAGQPSWNPVVGSTSSISPGNHFLVNAKGLSTSSATAVEVLLTNGDQLSPNYGHLNRRLNVYVLCDAPFACQAGPFAASTAPGEWGQARDAAGTDISAVADFLTLANARQGFILGGGYVYAIVVDGGTVFTVDTNEGVNDSLSPVDLAQSSTF